MLNVLFSKPNSTTDPVYLPNVFSILKTYCERDPVLAENVSWEEPVFQRDPVPDLLDRVEGRSVDVLGLGCYIWNWYAQRQIGETVKSQNPDCLVVAGGPNCNIRDPDFFRKNPFIDIVVRQEGEEPFRRILTQRLEGDEDWQSIPGLYVPDENGDPTRTSPPELLEEEVLSSFSPFLAQSDLLVGYAKRAREQGLDVFATFRSNRGCPYQCSFCDWGSLTNTRVRKRSLEMVKQELDWMARHRIGGVNIADANLGMFERDVEFIRHLCELKERHDYPRTMLWNPAKSEVNHLRSIVKLAHESDLRAQSMLALQHTDPDVLDAINRKNLSDKEVQSLIDFNRKHDIPTDVQLILGCPNDTYASWKECLTGLMERGLHGEYFISNFHLLPNSPAGKDDYQEAWEIETSLTRNPTHIDIGPDTHVPDTCQKQLITSTSTFDERDWIRMWVFGHLVQGLHTLGVTRALSVYLHYREDVTFNEFYSALVDEFGRDPRTLLSSLFAEVERDKEEFLRDDTKLLDRREHLEELPDLSHFLQWDEWLFVRVVQELDRFFEELEAFLGQRFQVDRTRLQDLISYQKARVVKPSYDPREGEVVECRYDWMEYFVRDSEALGRSPDDRPVRYRVDQTEIGDPAEAITWHRETGRDRLRTWVETVLCHSLRRLDLYTTHEMTRASSAPLVEH